MNKSIKNCLTACRNFISGVKCCNLPSRQTIANLFTKCFSNLKGKCKKSTEEDSGSATLSAIEIEQIRNAFQEMKLGNETKQIKELASTQQTDSTKSTQIHSGEQSQDAFDSIVGSPSMNSHSMRASISTFSIDNLPGEVSASNNSVTHKEKMYMVSSNFSQMNEQIPNTVIEIEKEKNAKVSLNSTTLVTPITQLNIVDTDKANVKKQIHSFEQQALSARLKRIENRNARMNKQSPANKENEDDEYLPSLDGFPYDIRREHSQARRVTYRIN